MPSIASYDSSDSHPLIATQLPSWYPLHSEHALKTIIVPLPLGFLEYLQEDGVFLPDDSAAVPQLTELDATLLTDGDYRRDDWDHRPGNAAATIATAGIAAAPAPQPSPSGPLHSGRDGLMSGSPRSSDLQGPGGSGSGSGMREDSGGTADGSDSEAASRSVDWSVRFPDLRTSLDSAISSLGGRVVPKLNWSCPTDALWVSPGGTLECRNADQVVLLLKSSDRVAHDVTLLMEAAAVAEAAATTRAAETATAATETTTAAAATGLAATTQYSRGATAAAASTAAGGGAGSRAPNLASACDGWPNRTTKITAEPPGEVVTTITAASSTLSSSLASFSSSAGAHGAHGDGQGEVEGQPPQPQSQPQRLGVTKREAGTAPGSPPGMLTETAVDGAVSSRDAGCGGGGAPSSDAAPAPAPAPAPGPEPGSWRLSREQAPGPGPACHRGQPAGGDVRAAVSSPSSSSSAAFLGLHPVLVLKKWYPLRQEREFRCFVRGGALAAASQRDISQVYPALTREVVGEVRRRLWGFWVERMRGSLPLQDYAFDVYVPSDSSSAVRLVDVNPLTDTTSPLLYDWEELGFGEGTIPSGEALARQLLQPPPPRQRAVDGREGGGSAAASSLLAASASASATALDESWMADAAALVALPLPSSWEELQVRVMEGDATGGAAVRPAVATAAGVGFDEPGSSGLASLMTVPMRLGSRAALAMPYDMLGIADSVDRMFEVMQRQQQQEQQRRRRRRPQQPQQLQPGFGGMGDLADFGSCEGSSSNPESSSSPGAEEEEDDEEDEEDEDEEKGPEEDRAAAGLPAGFVQLRPGSGHTAQRRGSGAFGRGGVGVGVGGGLGRQRTAAADNNLFVPDGLRGHDELRDVAAELAELFGGPGGGAGVSGFAASELSVGDEAVRVEAQAAEMRCILGGSIGAGELGDEER